MIKFVIPSIITINWGNESKERQQKIEKYVTDEFNKHIEKLNSISKNVSEVIITTFNSNNNFENIFRIINTYQLPENYTLELIDSIGNVLAWNGWSISSDYKHFLNDLNENQSIKLVQTGFRTYLTIGYKLMDYYILVSELIELNSPISNRFIQKVSICDDISEKLNVKVVPYDSYITVKDSNDFIITIKDYKGGIITEYLVKENNLQIEIEQAKSIITKLININIALATLFLSLFIIKLMKPEKKRMITGLITIVLLWIIRIIWRQLEFPANVINSWLFNPNFYASPFVFDMTSSIGELTISSITMLITAIVLFKYINVENLNLKYRIPKFYYHILSIIFSIGIILLILWMFRGVGEAIRSFVFDSTIEFDNPSEIFINAKAVLMYLNVLMISISLIIISIILLQFNKTVLEKWKKINLVQVILCIVAIVIFKLIDKTSPVYILYSIIYLTSIIILLEIYKKWKERGINEPTKIWRLTSCMLLISFLIGTMVLYDKIKEREQKYIETEAYKILRPSDSWLNFIVLDGLRTVKTNFLNFNIERNIKEAKKNNLAFILWTKTLLGKEGYNSALVIYDNQGNEVDKFVVGMSKLEQRELLMQVFESEEDEIIALKTGLMTGECYGVWTTFRNSSGQYIGSVAILISGQQKNIFGLEEYEPFRQYEVKVIRNYPKEIALHEYRNDTLLFSTGVKLFPGKLIPLDIKKALESSSYQSIWKEFLINGYHTQTLILKDQNDEKRIIAISVEKLDFRWGLFFYLKMLLIVILVIGIISILIFIKRDGYILPKLGFRGKLLLGFGCITIIPLLILGLYNKELVTQKVEQQSRKKLLHEIKQLRERLKTYISDEEDFIRGVDDDFCEAIASEYGIDFSIYRNREMQASSYSELYRASLLDIRINGKIFYEINFHNREFILTREKIGSIEYLVGYVPFAIENKVVGIIVVPTLNRQIEIEEEIAERNVYVFGVYALIFGIALLIGAILSYRFTNPLHTLTKAAKDISNGNLNINVQVNTRDEIGELANSFNDMVTKLRINMNELAKHERESAWREMAKQVAHEIKNPLTPIKLSIQHLRQVFKDKADNREETLQRITQTVIEQIDALSKIASEFSKFAKMPETKFEKFDIHELIKESVNLFKEIQGINFVENLSTTPIIVLADRDQLRVVLINLIRNAIQAIVGSGTITITTIYENQQCKIRISDTGPGIPEEILNKIFMPNFSTKTEGMGLGLAITRRIIEDHGGTILCKSSKGEGTTFEVTLPI